jgi:hypothetical protein
VEALGQLNRRLDWTQKGLDFVRQQKGDGWPEKIKYRCLQQAVAFLFFLAWVWLILIARTPRWR